MLSKDILKNIRRIQIRTNRTVNDMLGGAYLSAFKGQGIEFEDVREYLPGDDIRSIDWNVTARMHTPYIKNFREERELTVMLVVDISASNRFGTPQKTKGELMAELGAVLSFSAIKNSDKVGLILFTEKVETYIPPKKGLRHVLRVIRELLAFQARGVGTDVGAALAFLQKVQKKRGVVFLLSDFITPSFKETLAISAKTHDLIAVSISDPKELELPTTGLVSFRDLESQEEKIVDLGVISGDSGRPDRVRQLMQKVGAGFVDIRTDKPYADALHLFFREREKRR